MPEIRPFCGIRYNPEKIKNLADVTAQPYDQINDEMEKEYKRRSPYNFVRLILTKETAGHDREREYQDAKNYLESWLKENIFIKDPEPSLYPYYQTFKVDQKEYLRKGLICLLRIEELGKGSILPHERTLSKPKADRLNLMRITKKNLEYVFMLYTDPENRINRLCESETKNAPLIDLIDSNNVRHRVWKIADSSMINQAQQILKNSILVIADGHHRYETSFNYCEEETNKNPKHTGNEPYNFRLVTLVNIEDPGLVILPTHRLIKNLKDFNLSKFLKSVEEFFEVKTSTEKTIAGELNEAKVKTFGFYSPQGVYRLKLKNSDILSKFLPDKTAEYRDLDVVILHTLIIEHLLKIKPEEIENYVKYERGIERAIEQVKNGNFQFCFLMNPTRPSQVKEVAQQRDRMPQKSTDFYPKLLSGLVFYDLAG